MGQEIKNLKVEIEAALTYLLFRKKLRMEREVEKTHFKLICEMMIHIQKIQMVKMNKTEKLTEHFTLGEMTKTSYKTKYGNIPSHVAIENLKRVCSWLEMLRDVWNERYGEGNDPIIINSGYRSWEVNKRVGGSSTSQFVRKEIAGRYS